MVNKVNTVNSVNSVDSVDSTQSIYHRVVSCETLDEASLKISHGVNMGGISGSRFSFVKLLKFVRTLRVLPVL